MHPYGLLLEPPSLSFPRSVGRRHMLEEGSPPVRTCMDLLSPLYTISGPPGSSLLVRNGVRRTGFPGFPPAFPAAVEPPSEKRIHVFAPVRLLCVGKTHLVPWSCPPSLFVVVIQDNLHLVDRKDTLW